MNLVYERCAGLDIGKKSVVVCLRTPKLKEIRTFGMMTGDLLALGDWLAEHGATHVAMESTGVYWKPIYNILEAYTFELLLVNPHDFKAVPGRKTDVKDCDWLCDLLRHGLLRASFVPDRPHRELREVVRYRTSLVEERAREINRLEKVLEGANIKLGAVISTLAGKSARDMLWALANGQRDTTTIAELARGAMRSKRPLVAQALEGRIGEHQRFMLREQLTHLNALDAAIGRLDQEVAARLLPFEEKLRALETIPGIGRRLAEVIVAEIGVDMSRFPTDGHLASWAKVCPGNNESAGKRKTGRTGRGNTYLRSALTEAAHGGSQTKGTYLQAQYHRIAGRRGGKRAIMAVAHTILIIIYHLLKDGGVYQDLGNNYFDEIKEHQVVHRMQRRLQSLGYDVTILKRAA